MPEAHPTLETWCPATKEQGFAGSKAPRPTCRRPIRPQRRGAPRRRNKGSRGAEHHVRSAGGSTTQAEPRTHPRPKAHPVPSRPRTPGRRLSKPATASPPPAGGRKVRTGGAGMVSNPSAAGGPRRPAPRLATTAKPVNQKNRDCPWAVPVLSAFAILICNPTAVQDSFPS